METETVKKKSMPKWLARALSFLGVTLGCILLLAEVMG